MTVMTTIIRIAGRICFSIAVTPNAVRYRPLDCFASLAMTSLRGAPPGRRSNPDRPRITRGHGGDEEVDRLDAEERDDDAAEAVNQQIAAQHCPLPFRPVFHALQRQRN